MYVMSRVVFQMNRFYLFEKGAVLFNTDVPMSDQQIFGLGKKMNSYCRCSQYSAGVMFRAWNI